MLNSSKSLESVRITEPTSAEATHGRGFMFVVLVVALSLAGCDGGTAERFGDPTSYLGATVWVLEGTVESLEVPTSRQTLLTIRVDKVLQSEDHYFWGGVQYPLPIIDPGSSLDVDIRVPSGDPLNRGQSYIFGVQAAGVPADLAAGKRSNDGALSHTVVAVFDTDGQVVQTALYPMEPIREVLALYGRGPDAIRELIGDAQQTSVAQNLQYAAEAGRSTEELSKTPSPPEILTEGPLGEWRRENGWEGLNSPETPADKAAALAVWLDIPWEERQLFVDETEVLEGAAEALGVQWVHTQLVFPQDVEAALHPLDWVGLRFSDVGILGPFSTQVPGEDDGLLTILGMVPKGVQGELVAWEGPADDFGSAKQLGVLEADLLDGSVTVTFAPGGPDVFQFVAEETS